MTPISTGSTLTPCFSSQVMARPTSLRAPSSSRQTMPISSVTLAWRMLVVILNLRPTSQMNGCLMSFGGYISHRRCCTGEFGLVTETFFFLVAINDFVFLLPLTPALSLGERENRSQSQSKTRDWICRRCIRKTKRQRSLFLLLGGEG